MINTGHAAANAALKHELCRFEEVCGPRNYTLMTTYETTPAIFSLTQQELDEADPFAWPHHYRVVVLLDLGYWVNKVVDSIVHDLTGAIRALVEGVELGVSAVVLGDWMTTRLES